jgi:choline kinase/mannose-6-phosphate isomerase-like protein (cupin superfamily)|tara:strand:+ start:960 stop:2879 length:1920 start_codon:yes stop_codon:yes gene_type:complete
MYKVVHKPWGKEEWLALNEFYCYKRIYINAGYKTSFQWHEQKHETNYIIKGEAEVWLENDEGEIIKKVMKAGDFFDVVPPKKHRVIAITDIILQEVSTPHVDDVFRINDEFNRADGKIDAEHKTPSVFLLAAGVGSRLKNLTDSVNKAMLPINNKAIISNIIEKFPKEYEIVVALGYKGDELEQYCKLAHPLNNFKFITISDFDGEDSGPGQSALQCKEYLQRPFYFIVADCIIDSKLPHLDGNWLGVYPTSYPEKYSTVKIDTQDNILDFVNKSDKGFDNAFIGLASIWDYKTFWNQLQSNIKKGEIVSAFNNVDSYPNFKVKHLKWLDTGNLDDLNKTKEYFNDKPLSLYKVTSEITYKLDNNFLKFNPSKKNISNKSKRAKELNGLIPPNFQNTENFISYKWEPGKTLYEWDSLPLYNKFLDKLSYNIKMSKTKNGDEVTFNDFYVDKTKSRMDKFINRFGKKYFTQSFTINGVKRPSFEKIMDKIDLTPLYDNPLYSLFHGDLQFDNIVYNDEEDKFTYIDWRESFGGDTSGGDIYYDLAKMYGGTLIPYNLAKLPNFVSLNEGVSFIDYSYSKSDNLTKFVNLYKNWIIKEGWDWKKIKLITALIFLNMSPLHDEKFGKMLWFKSLELFDEIYK